MPGIDINRFIDLNEKLSANLSCSICLNVFDNAVNSECQHSFCRQCIQQWIDTNHRECPKCKTVFASRKRTTRMEGSTDLMLLGPYVFKHTLIANAIINDLKIKCSFDYNGCPEVIEFGSLESHLKDCEHKICKTCGISAQPIEVHNCLQLMKNKMEELKSNYEEIQQFLGTERTDKKELELRLKSSQQTVSELKNKINRIEVIIKRQKAIICGQNGHSISFGTYKRFATALEETNDGIRIKGVPPNSKGANSVFHILIPFTEMEEFKYSSHSSFPFVIIKPSIESCLKIQESLCLGTDSPNGLKFDVNSENPKERYIVIDLKAMENDSDFIKSIVENSKRIDFNINCEEIVIN